MPVIYFSLAFYFLRSSYNLQDQWLKNFMMGKKHHDEYTAQWNRKIENYFMNL